MGNIDWCFSHILFVNVFVFVFFKVPILKEGIFNVNELSRQLSEKSGSIESEINETFDRLIRLVEMRRNQVILELQQKETAKQETLCKSGF